MALAEWKLAIVGSQEQTWSELTAYISEGTMSLKFAQKLASTRISEESKRDLAAQVAAGAILGDVAVALARAEEAQRNEQRDRMLRLMKVPLTILVIVAVVGGMAFGAIMIGGHEAEMALQAKEVATQQFDAATEAMAAALTAKGITAVSLEAATLTKRVSARLTKSTRQKYVESTTLTLGVLLDRRFRLKGITVDRVSRTGDRAAFLRTVVTSLGRQHNQNVSVRTIHLELVETATEHVLWQDVLNILDVEE